MRIALAAVGFVTHDVSYNQAKIITSMAQYAEQADLIVFGEAFLQGFNCLSWEYEQDREVALAQDSTVICEIAEATKNYGIAVSFGYIERAKNQLFSSQMTLDASGKLIHNYRRISSGWKESQADGHYSEGKGFDCFHLQDKLFTVGLCGDLWYDIHCEYIKSLDVDIVLWPVYTDFDMTEWNGPMKMEYAAQAAKCGTCALYVNAYCQDAHRQIDTASGGAAYFKAGHIIQEVAAGAEQVLLVEV